MAKDKPPKGKPAADPADAERFEDAVRRVLSAPKAPPAPKAGAKDAARKKKP